MQWQDGYIIPPTAPGLGVELDEAVALAHPYVGNALHPGHDAHAGAGVVAGGAALEPVVMNESRHPPHPISRGWRMSPDRDRTTPRE